MGGETDRSLILYSRASYNGKLKIFIEIPCTIQENYFSLFLLKIFIFFTYRIDEFGHGNGFIHTRGVDLRSTDHKSLLLL